VAASLAGVALSELAEDAGLSLADLEAAATLLTEAERPLITTGRGGDQNSRGVETTLAWINLALALGAGYGTLTGQANGQGGREHGMKADQLPGYRSIKNSEDRRAVAEVWGVDEADLPGAGLSAYEMLQAVGRGEVKGLFVLGSNPVASSPNARSARANLECLEHLVVVDTFMSETAALAHVVLPGSLWAEEGGTTTNLEGRVLLRHALRLPPAGARRDLDIICELAARLGARRGFDFSTSEEVFDELRRATAGAVADYAGISYARLRAGEALFWPCPDEAHPMSQHPGTPRPFETRFGHPDGRARFHVAPVRPPAEVPCADFPFQLTTGRVRFHYLTGNHTRRTKLLKSRAPEPVLELHPNVARAHGLLEGHLARVTTRRSYAVFRVKLSDKIREDTLFLPFHWAVVNTLTNDALDPHCKMPEFKVCAAALSPLVGPDDPHTPAIR
jgi:assimilatory nitrate reductase catalytic subunit